ncbi:hypothetical protein ABBQ38_008136 [Trebouxia sp. C0009 RCD-2024]
MGHSLTLMTHRMIKSSTMRWVVKVREWPMCKESRFALTRALLLAQDAGDGVWMWQGTVLHSEAEFQKAMEADEVAHDHYQPPSLQISYLRCELPGEGGELEVPLEDSLEDSISQEHAHHDGLQDQRAAESTQATQLAPLAEAGCIDQEDELTPQQVGLYPGRIRPCFGKGRGFITRSRVGEVFWASSSIPLMYIGLPVEVKAIQQGSKSSVS